MGRIVPAKISNLGPHLKNFLARNNNEYFEEELPNEMFAKGKRLYLKVHVKVCELGNVILAC